jgi:uncharacterized protein DUF6884
MAPPETRDVMARQIALVAAPRARRGGILRARDQFDASPLFRRARDYCERAGMEWYILSATHSLLAPLQVVGDGGGAVQALGAEERLRWAGEIAAHLDALMARSGQPLVFMLLASQRYADLLTRAAPHLPLMTPLSGLGVSARLRWFDERLRVRSRLLAPHERPDGGANER